MEYQTEQNKKLDVILESFLVLLTDIPGEPGSNKSQCIKKLETFVKAIKDKEIANDRIMERAREFPGSQLLQMAHQEIMMSK